MSHQEEPVGRPGPADVLSHAQLVAEGRRAAAVLSRLGVRAGDRLAVLLPMSPESVVVTLACVQLDVLRISLPLGDRTGWVRHRIRSAGVTVAVTADSCLHEDAVIPVKASLDQALAGCPDVRDVLVVQQLARPVSWTPGRDRWWHEELAAGALPPRPYPGDMSESPLRGPDGGPVPDPAASLIFDDPLTRQSADDGDEGWGDRPAAGGAAADLARFLDEKPPHHL